MTVFYSFVVYLVPKTWRIWAFVLPDLCGYEERILLFLSQFHSFVLSVSAVTIFFSFHDMCDILSLWQGLDGLLSDLVD